MSTEDCKEHILTILEVEEPILIDDEIIFCQRCDTVWRVVDLMYAVSALQVVSRALNLIEKNAKP